MVNHPKAQDASVRHNSPNYHAEVDQASSFVHHSLTTYYR